VLHSDAEDRAKGKAINAVAQLLVQAGSRGVLRLPGQTSAVTVDRVVVAGSVGKHVSVQGDFDFDLVAFLNLPAAAGVRVDLCNPDNTQDSFWMQRLQQQVLQHLQQHLPARAGLRCVSPPGLGRTAIKFTLLVAVPESGEEVELDVDVLLAPNMSTGAGAAAAAAWGVGASSGTPAEVQRQAVLAPVLALAADAARTGAASSATAAVVPSFVRNIWLTEAATEFTQQAAVADAERGGMSGRVVTSTIRLMKAWVRKGVHRCEKDVGMSWLKSFQIELLVLHAAERFARNPHPVYGGRYVLDLLLETLHVVKEWADRACGTVSSSDRVLFTELVQGRCYSRQQALALQQLPKVRASFAEQPAVVHPVDPLKNVFGEGGRSREWGALRREAQLLLEQLQQSSWERIMRNSTLGAALRT
jgi:hypothetical protein